MSEGRIGTMKWLPDGVPHGVESRGFRGVFVICVLVLAALVSGCERADIYTLADEGVPVITALANNDDATATIMLRVTADGFYKREFSTPVAASAATMFSVTDNRNVAIADGTTSVYIRDTNNGSWMTTSLGFVPGKIVSRGDQFFAFGTTDAYVYNRDSKTWTLSKTLPQTPVSVAVQDNRIIWNWSSGGQIYTYDFDSGAEALATFNQGPGATSRPLFLIDDVIYTGYIATDVIRIYTAGVLTAYLSLAGLVGNGFTISGGEVFAGVYDTATLAIYRMSGSTFVREYSFTSTAGSMMLGSVSSDTIAIAINGSTVDDGLYAYNHRNQSMRKLSFRSIQMMHIR